ncbi:MAG: hypothetical protein GF330_13415 [Candidatus Eisenbacteria bacterium]|nr:hypothetical protein [Candidatus Eisenbacteria bacterium]
MTQIERSKREHCPQCDSIQMYNYVHVVPGRDAEVFIECLECGAFVARYTLRAYTSEDPYRSYLRLMRQRHMSSGAATRKAVEQFRTELWNDYRRVKEMVQAAEESRSVEDLLEEIE